MWPAYREGQPVWKIVDIESYINEGFNLNTLIYSAVMYKARASATAPLKAFRGTPERSIPLEPEHPLSQLVARPNLHQSWVEFQMQNIVYENIAGNVFIFLDRPKGGGLPEAMYSLRPDRVFVIPGRTNGQTGIKGYAYFPEGVSHAGANRDAVGILPEDMIHIKLPNPGDPMEGMGEGLSPLSPVARSADVDNSITKFLKMFFDTGAMVTGALSFDVPIDDEILARVKERWREIYGGFENWDIGVFDRGATYQRVGLTFEEMGFEGQDERNETRILGPFGVPPILIGSRIGLMRSTYANYKEARTAFWEDTFVPEMSLFEVDFQYFLQTPDGGFVKFDYKNVPALQQDIPAIVTAWGELVDRGISREDAATTVGLSLQKAAPLEMEEPELIETEPEPDANVGAIEAETDERRESDTDKQLKLLTEEKQRLAKQVDDTAVEFEPQYEKVTEQAFENDRREILAIVNEAKKKSLARKATPDWDAAMVAINAYLADSENWQIEFTPVTEAVFVAQAEMWQAIIEPPGVDLTPEYFNNQFSQEWFDEYKLVFAQPINDTTSKEISQVLAQAQAEGWSVDKAENRLGQLFDQWIDGDLTAEDFEWLDARTPPYRREMIVRTESIRAANASSDKLFNDWGVEKKEWLTARDERVRDAHKRADGQVVAADESFRVGGEALRFPGDPRGAPENTINCRCVALPVV